MDNMKSKEETEVVENKNINFGEFMDNMKSKEVEEYDSRNINFGEYMDGMKSKYDDNVQVVASPNQLMETEVH